jgi:branched-chain amino acid aminotransferase
MKAMTHPQENLSITSPDTGKQSSPLGFGEAVSPHMLVASYRNQAWSEPLIRPYGKIELAPTALGFHYGQTVFEGMKAFRRSDGLVNIFRLEKHFERMNKTLERMCMPLLPETLFSEGLRQLIQADADWVPESETGSLYIRPFMFASEERFGVKVSDEYLFVIFSGPVGSYFSQSLKVKVEDRFIRAAPGGTGYVKCGGNYGGAFYPTQLAKADGFDQVLWTDGSAELHIEESGMMNVVFVIDGVITTPPLSDTILDGVTRDSVLTLGKTMGYEVVERKISAYELVERHRLGQLQEAFGVGTAAVTSPISLIRVKDTDLNLPSHSPESFCMQVREKLTRIRTGQEGDSWGWNTLIMPT